MCRESFFEPEGHKILRVMKMAKTTMAQKMLSRLNIPAEAAVSAVPAPRITISGDGRVLVEGHRGLLEYAADRIAAAGPGCRILIKGENLGLVAMNRREMVVSGRLWAVELE